MQCMGSDNILSLPTFRLSLPKWAVIAPYFRPCDMLRDRLVMGINDKCTQRYLLTEPKLTFTKAEEIALTIELATRDTCQLCPTSESSVVHCTDSSSHNKKSDICSRSNKVVCYRCGGAHFASACQHIDTVCRACSKRSHLARVFHSKHTPNHSTCKSSNSTPNSMSSPTHHLTSNDVNTSDTNS